MVLETLSHYLSKGLHYYLPYIIILTSIYSIRRYSAGFISREERNLHNKTFLLIGGCSGPGLELLKALALRGAQIIVLHPNPNSPSILQLILLLRSTTGNERIYVDACDMKDLASVRSFVKRWEKDGRVGMVGDLEARLEAVVFCGDEENDYLGKRKGEGDVRMFGGIGVGRIGLGEKKEREICHQTRLLSRHAMIQLLLPTLVRSSTHSPVRIINDISPFYSILPLDLTDLDYLTRPYPINSPWLVEGQIALGSISLFRELQDRVDENKKTDTGGIVVMSVCGGFTRSWFRRTLRATSSSSSTGGADSTWLGLLVYTLLYPFIYIGAKSAEEASQGMLAAVLGSVRKEDVPSVLIEETEEETRIRIEKEKKEKEELESKIPSVRLRGGMVYREGKEIRVTPLEQAKFKSSDLWRQESKIVETLVAKAAIEETSIEKEKEDLRKEKLVNKNKEKEKGN